MPSYHNLYPVLMTNGLGEPAHDQVVQELYAEHNIPAGTWEGNFYPLSDAEMAYTRPDFGPNTANGDTILLGYTAIYQGRRYFVVTVEYSYRAEDRDQRNPRQDTQPYFAAQRLRNEATTRITAESGGYTQLLLLPFVFMERWRGLGRTWAIIAAYILCIPTDIHLQTLGTFVRDSFVSGREVYADYDIALGHFLRPGLFMSIPFALSLVTIRDVLADVRVNGLRWRRQRMLSA